MAPKGLDEVGGKVMPPAAAGTSLGLSADAPPNPAGNVGKAPKLGVEVAKDAAPAPSSFLFREGCSSEASLLSCASPSAPRLPEEKELDAPKEGNEVPAVVAGAPNEGMDVPKPTVTGAGVVAAPNVKLALGASLAASTVAGAGGKPNPEVAAAAGFVTAGAKPAVASLVASAPLEAGAAPKLGNENPDLVAVKSPALVVLAAGVLVAGAATGAATVAPNVKPLLLMAPAAGAEAGAGSA
mmetsp:Transcript_54248/g.94615  ORF Transcript_54248/g.94615 Transcript_54248/m.94615 type:complete len:240 (-) Transcript_54248:75-794(-)